MPLLYHAYVYLEFLILVCTIYILAPPVCAGAFFRNKGKSTFRLRGSGSETSLCCPAQCSCHAFSAPLPPAPFPILPAIQSPSEDALFLLYLYSSSINAWYKRFASTALVVFLFLSTIWTVRSCCIFFATDFVEALLFNRNTVPTYF